MGTLESLWVALDTLRTHKLRSFLTMLGVIFGVMAVVVMVALIEGARASVIEEFEKLGSDVIIVAFDPSERIRREARGGTVEGLTVADLEAIRQLPELRAVAAERQLGQKELIYRGEKVQASLIGVNEDYLTVRALSVERGRFFEPRELEQGEKLLVLGHDTARKLFGKDDPIGQSVLIDGTQAQVIGVLAKRGRGFGENLDEGVYIPLNAALRRWAGDETLSTILAVPHTRAPLVVIGFRTPEEAYIAKAMLELHTDTAVLKQYAHRAGYAIVERGQVIYLFPPSVTRLNGYRIAYDVVSELLGLLEPDSAVSYNELPEPIRQLLEGWVQQAIDSSPYTPPHRDELRIGLFYKVEMRVRLKDRDYPVPSMLVPIEQGQKGGQAVSWR